MTGFRAIAWWFLKQFVRFKFPNVPHISTQELSQWLQRRQSEPFLLLDARSPEDVA
ncbi:MAG: rhodanese-like domain-containing protein, partial [Coleofasciculaceae cyanobacterium SM2_3_26]|nr:rhodanese-like domain-containing protein [Coleofasciculaceae cyanobacterium SM2_3_26]